MKQVTAVIPCFNEEKTIARVITESRRHVDQVLVVDDGSDDKTVWEALRAGALVTSHLANRGKGAALNTAFTLLRREDCPAAVLLDGDGQHDPSEIPLLLAPVLTGRADIVIGSRYLRQAHLIPAYRRLGQTVLNAMTNLGSGLRVTDSQSGFRAFSSAAINHMRFREKGLAVESEMQFIVRRTGLRVFEVPITTIYSGGHRRSPLVHGFGVLYRVIRLSLGYQLCAGAGEKL